MAVADFGSLVGILGTLLDAVATAAEAVGTRLENALDFVAVLVYWGTDRVVGMLVVH